jgi:hypothetical protein
VYTLDHGAPENSTACHESGQAAGRSEAQP